MWVHRPKRHHHTTTIMLSVVKMRQAHRPVQQGRSSNACPEVGQIPDKHVASRADTQQVSQVTFGTLSVERLVAALHGPTGSHDKHPEYYMPVTAWFASVQTMVCLSLCSMLCRVV